jgi:hypothetical protein
VDGNGGWGDEIKLRASLEKKLGEWGSQVVTLCIQGGPLTIKTVLGSIENMHAVVVVADSGGAATDIAHHLGLLDNLEYTSHLTPEVLDDLDQIKAHHDTMGGLVFAFSAHGAMGLDEVILAASALRAFELKSSAPLHAARVRCELATFGPTVCSHGEDDSAFRVQV